jgi:hypothetical protein
MCCVLMACLALDSKRITYLQDSQPEDEGEGVGLELSDVTKTRIWGRALACQWHRGLLSVADSHLQLQKHSH